MTVNLNFDTINMPDDIGPEPPPDELPEHQCEYPGCTNETFRNGTRGRWPKFCEDHKKVTTTSSTPRVSRGSGDAEAATNFLCKLNLFLGMGLRAAGLEQTEQEIIKANDDFRIFAYEALSLDPKLAKKIIGAGGTSGQAGLVMAYAMFGMSVGATGYREFKEKRNAAEG